MKAATAPGLQKKLTGADVENGRFRGWSRCEEWPRRQAGYGSAASKHSLWTYNDLPRSSGSPSACGDSLLWTWRPVWRRGRGLASRFPDRANLLKPSVPLTGLISVSSYGTVRTSRLQRPIPDRHLISPRAPDESFRSGSPAEWSDFVRHGRELHGSVQGPYGVAGRAGTVSGQCTWTLHRLPVRTTSKEATWRLRPVSSPSTMSSRGFRPRIAGC